MHKANINNEFAKDLQSLYNHIYKIIRQFHFDEHTCQDITQEIMIKFYNKIDTFQGNSRIQTWLYVMVKNYCLNYKQRVYDKNPLPVDFSDLIIEPDNSESTENRFFKSELKKAINYYVDKLPAQLKKPLTYFYYHNLKYKDIALKMNIPEGTVKSRINAAKRKLYNLLKEYTHTTEWINIPCKRIKIL